MGRSVINLGEKRELTMMSFGSKAAIVGSFIVLVTALLGLVGIFSSWEETLEAERGRLKNEISELRIQSNQLVETQEIISEKLRSTTQTYEKELKKRKEQLTKEERKSLGLTQKLERSLMAIQELDKKVKRLSVHLSSEKRKRQECRDAVNEAERILDSTLDVNISGDKLKAILNKCLN